MCIRDSNGSRLPVEAGSLLCPQQQQQQQQPSAGYADVHPLRQRDAAAFFQSRCDTDCRSAMTSGLSCTSGGGHPFHSISRLMQDGSPAYGCYGYPTPVDHFPTSSYKDDVYAASGGGGTYLPFPGAGATQYAAAATPSRPPATVMNQQYCSQLRQHPHHHHHTGLYRTELSHHLHQLVQQQQQQQQENGSGAASYKE